MIKEASRTDSFDCMPSTDLRAVYDRNMPRVYRLCYLRLGHREDAEDAAQNVFFRWMRHPAVFRSEEHEKAYFIRAACNECKNIKRSFWHSRRESIDDLPESIAQTEDALPEETGLLNLLPLKYRDVMYLFYYEEYPAAEIAKLLGRNESTVRTQLQTGRKLLRAALDKQGGKQ